MKKLLVLLVFVLNNTSFAQKGALLGSGVIVSKSFDFEDFDKLSVEDFDGKIDVEIGKPFSINLEIDDNLESLFRIDLEKSDKLLKIYLDKNKNGKLYLENAHIRIKVTMPFASFVNHRGNTNLKVLGISGRYFRFENTGNGDVVLKGKVDELDIKKTGNGNINAKGLFSKMAKVKNIGNGNVVLNAEMSLLASGFGNGDVIQTGKGQIEALSGIVGNGEVRRN